VLDCRQHHAPQYEAMKNVMREGLLLRGRKEGEEC
jgi:hypothetical protein